MGHWQRCARTGATDAIARSRYNSIAVHLTLLAGEQGAKEVDRRVGKNEETLSTLTRPN
jgi:hypothetical protein